MSYQIFNADELETLLQDLNERGDEPTVIGYDSNGSAFMAYGYDLGDTMGTGVNYGDPFDSYTGVESCQECSVSERLPLTILTYPVRLFP